MQNCVGQQYVNQQTARMVSAIRRCEQVAPQPLRDRALEAVIVSIYLKTLIHYAEDIFALRFVNMSASIPQNLFISQWRCLLVLKLKNQTSIWKLRVDSTWFLKTILCLLHCWWWNLRRFIIMISEWTSVSLFCNLDLCSAMRVIISIVSTYVILIVI